MSISTKSLGTTSLRRAQRARDQLLGSYRKKWERLRNAPSSDPAEKQWVLEKLAEIAEEVREGLLDPREAPYQASELIDMHRDATGKEIDAEDAAQIRDAVQAVRDPSAITLGEAVRTYLAAIKPEVRNQTYRQRERRYKMLLDFLGSSRRLKDVTRESAGRFVDKVIQPRDDWSPSTKKGVIRDMHAFFRHAYKRGLVTSNPFHDMASTIPESKRGTAAGKPRPWTEEELLKVFSGLDLNKHWKVFAGGVLLLYTGARLEEILTRRTEHVVENGKGLYVDEGKNESSIRTIPLHPIIQPLVSHLAENTNDYLLPGYKPRGQNAKLGDGFGRQFRAIQERLKVPIRARGGVAVHDLRRTFKTQAEACRLDQRIIDEIQGHTKEGMRSVYSHGFPFKDKLKEIKKLTYGSKVDTSIKRRIAELTAG